MQKCDLAIMAQLPDQTPLSRRSGVIVADIDGRLRSMCIFIVLLDDARLPDDLLVFVPPGAFTPREAPRSKSHAARQNERERGFHIGKPDLMSQCVSERGSLTSSL